MQKHDESHDIRQYYPVILQLGSRFIKAGFAGDALPVSFLNTSNPIFNQQEISIDRNDSLHSNHAISQLVQTHELEGDIKANYESDLKSKKWLWNYDYLSIPEFVKFSYNLENLLERMIYHIYSKDLLTNAKKCKVIIPEPILLPTFIKKSVSKVLLHHIHSQSIIFIPEPMLACIGAGVRNGLVVDVGWDSVSITPVYDLRILHNMIKTSTRAGKLLHYKTLEKLQPFLNFADTFSVVENLICEVFFCSTLNKKVDDDGEFKYSNELIFPNKLRHEIIDEFFFNNSESFLDNEELMIVDIIDKLIAGLPIDIRKELSTNIIFTGGLSNIPGLKTRILQELRLKSEVQVESTVSVGVWCGASIYCSTTLMTSQNFQKVNELTRDKFLVNDSKIPDWIDQMYDPIRDRSKIK